MTMIESDKELLELAAKAIGLTLRRNYWGGQDANQPWNPLMNDDDALRLAVDLEIAINPYAGKVVTWSEANNMAGVEKWESDDEACTAVRRAITRAAAKIAKEMK